jgi:hypothetical protein
MRQTDSFGTNLVRLSFLGSAKDSNDFRCKLTEPIGSDPNRNLRNDRLITLHLPPGSTGLPGRRDNASSKSAEVWEKLWAQTLFCPVISDEVPYDGVARARPQSATTTTIITRFPSKQSIAERRDRILNNELTLPCSPSLGESTETLIPLWIGVMMLIA